jgi:hypothetical protein
MVQQDEATAHVATVSSQPLQQNNTILSTKNGKGNLPIEDNLQKERSEEKNSSWRHKKIIFETNDLNV